MNVQFFVLGPACSDLGNCAHPLPDEPFGWCTETSDAGRTSRFGEIHSYGGFPSPASGRLRRNSNRLQLLYHIHDAAEYDGKAPGEEVRKKLWASGNEAHDLFHRRYEHARGTVKLPRNTSSMPHQPVLFPVRVHVVL